MQTKELIKALRDNADSLCSNEYHVDVKNDLLSQAADALEAQEWRDIGDAPKDKRLILWDNETGLAVSGEWFGDPGQDTPGAYEPPSCGWASDDDLIHWDGVNNPTHWKPLTPPEAE